VAAHEGLGEGLGALELRRGARGAEDAQAVRTEFIDHAGRERRLGADHGEADLVFLRPDAQRLHVGDGQVVEGTRQRRAAVARRDVNLAGLGRLAQLPGQCVFAATAADDENVHGQSAAL
jgi:hypothetical protein